MERTQAEPSSAVTVWKYRLKKYGLRIGLSLFALYSAVTFFLQSGTLARQAGELEDIRARIQEARAGQIELKATADYMQTDEFIERYARDALGLLREGEIRFVDEGER